jgi:hypothetical protein
MMRMKLTTRKTHIRVANSEGERTGDGPPGGVESFGNRCTKSQNQRHARLRRERLGEVNESNMRQVWTTSNMGDCGGLVRCERVVKANREDRRHASRGRV